jgi:hypothetical protein
LLVVPWLPGMILGQVVAIVQYSIEEHGASGRFFALANNQDVGLSGPSHILARAHVSTC